MINEIGNVNFEAVCPLCLTIYSLDYDDIHSIGYGEGSRQYMYCRRCERNIFIDPNDRKLFRNLYHYK